MSEEVVLTFGDRGSVQFVYEDAENAFGSDISYLLDAGKFVTERASHVEPGIEPLAWTADMRPMAGPVLGPFTLRREALKAEREWLRNNRGL
jgi:hypothetical protein|tara:strand:- start:275 stop:550 length:276 start_codon:yes stop_codon:yes gene_type:complete